MKRLCILTLTLCSLNVWAWDFQDISSTLTNCPSNAGTVAWGDVNCDGFQDLFVGGHHGSSSALYIGNGSQLLEAGEVYNISWMTNIRSAQFIDYDLDGRLDLFCLTDDESAVLLCNQQSDGRYRPIPIALAQDNARALTSSWHDLDGDGYPELLLSLVGSGGSSMSVYHHSELEFSEERGSAFPELDMQVSSMTWADWNHDGLADLFVGSANSDHSCRLLTRTESGWEDRTPYEAFDPKIGVKGCVWADFDNNQRLDFFTPGLVEHTTLQMYQPDSPTAIYKNMAPVIGLDQTAGNSEYAHAIDANMDGWMDIFALRSGVKPGNALMINSNGDSWKDVAADVGIELMYEHNNACAWADFDNDGDPDLAIAQEGTGVKLFRNNVEHRHEYVTLRLCQSDWNAPISGCQIWFQFEHAKAIASTDQWLSSNGDDGSSITLVNSSAFKSADVLCRVTWPSGEVSEFNLQQLQMNKVNTLHMPTSSPRIEAVSFEGQGRDAGGASMGNSPNPFNPTTSVEFTLNSADHVRLSIYNLHGQEVATLADTPFESGVHRVTFDAGNLPSGQYLARLTTTTTSVVHKMLLLK